MVEEKRKVRKYEVKRKEKNIWKKKQKVTEIKKKYFLLLIINVICKVGIFIFSYISV